MVSAELPDNWQELIAGYILGNLSDDEAALVERLLNEHPHLLQELEAFETAFDSLATTVPLYQPSEQLRAKILTATEAQFAVDSTIVQPKRRWKWIVGLGSAIAATTLLVLGWRVATLNTELQQATNRIQRLERDLEQANLQAQTVQPVLNTLQQPGTLIYSLQGSDRAHAASGSLVMSAESNQVIILVQNLPELPTGQIYRLWANVPSKATLAYCGQFNTNAQGFVKLTPSASVCGANPTQMLITIDAITDPTTRGGPVIMQSRT